ncbi:MAG: DUF4397 domain-containing protein [Chitinophagaceae bacterium]|nr:MAG: DUF4397 domain-containing protein [Chitinophagaceae bacterium]
MQWIATVKPAQMQRLQMLPCHNEIQIKPSMKLKYLLSSAAGLAMMVVFSGCLKNTPIEPTKPASYVSVLNMSFRSPAVEMLFGAEKVTAPISGGMYFPRYNNITPGFIDISFKKASSDSVVAQLQTGLYYDSLTYYSVLLYDKDAGGAGVIRIKDEFPMADPSRSFVRFFHMAPGQPQVDVQINNTRVFTSRTQADNTYNSSYNQFSGVTPGSFPIVIKQAGTDSVIASTPYSDLSAGGIYTLVLKGTTAGTGSGALGIELIRAAN